MKLIIACDPRGGIGYQNNLPWTNIQGDLPRFKQLTQDQVVIMGRNTWESLPKKPLPSRLNFVVTSQSLSLPHGAISIPDLKHFDNFNNSWIIGGAQLINSNWHLIDEVHLTKTLMDYTCDTFIDIVQFEKDFKCLSIEYYEDHSYQIWKRR